MDAGQPRSTLQTVTQRLQKCRCNHGGTEDTEIHEIDSAWISVSSVSPWFFLLLDSEEERSAAGSIEDPARVGLGFREIHE